MAKKIQNSVKKYAPIIAVLASLAFAIVAICMIFAPCVTIESLDSSYTGSQLMFGYKETGAISEAVVLNASANIVTFVLMIVGVVAVILSALMKKQGKLLALVAAVALVVAGVFWFLVIQFSAPNAGSLTGEAADEFIEARKSLYTLGAGAIVGGIFSILAGLASASLIFIKK